MQESREQRGSVSHEGPGVALPGPLRASFLAPTFFREIVMSKHSSMCLAIAVATSMVAGIAQAQYPIMDRVAGKVIEKYQNSSCEQLWQEKAQGQGQPKPEMEQRAIQMLQQDPQMRQAFFNQVAAPIVNKMFECGMIP